jgi:hypothetical protein
LMEKGTSWAGVGLPGTRHCGRLFEPLWQFGGCRQSVFVARFYWRSAARSEKGRIEPFKGRTSAVAAEIRKRRAVLRVRHHARLMKQQQSRSQLA